MSDTVKLRATITIDYEVNLARYGENVDAKEAAVIDQDRLMAGWMNVSELIEIADNVLMVVVPLPA